MGINTLVDIEPKIGEIESVSFRSNKFGVIQIGDTDSYIVFYNGVYYTSKHFNRITNTQALIDGKVQIGRNWQYNSENRSFYGSIQSIRIYNRVLTDEEVLHNYNIDKIRFGIT